MSRYSISVKRGNSEYSISSDNKDFITSYVSKVFSDLKSKSHIAPEVSYAKLNVEKAHEAEEKSIAQDQLVDNNTVELRPSQCEEKAQDDDSYNDRTDLKSESSQESFCEVGETELENEPLSSEDNQSQSDISSVEAVSGLDLELTKKEDNEEHKEENKEPIVTEGFSFENILEDKIQNPVYEEKVLSESSFDYEAIIKMKQPETLIDYLVITAYYMLENEGTEVFQLKQLNAKLFKSMKMVVDRKTMQKAVQDGLFDIVSAEIGDEGILEYSITSKGKEFYLNGCA